MKSLSDKYIHRGIAGILLFFSLMLVSPMARAVEQYHIKDYGDTVFKGKILIDEWRIEEAYELAKRLLDENPKGLNNRFLMSLTLFYRGDYEEALKFIDDDNLKRKNTYDMIRTTYEQTKSFVKKESEHFIVSFMPGKDEILADQALIALEGAYKNIGDDLGFYPKEKKVVEIYPTIKSFTAVSTLTKEEIETSGTIALCKFNRLMITSPRVLLRGYRWMKTLSHEYVHYIVYTLSGGTAPIWLHEGIAKYLEDRFNSETLGYMTPSSENVLSRRLKNDSLITLDEMHPSMAKLKSGEDVQVAFAEVNTMIDYMVRLKGFDSIKRVLELMAEGKSDFEAIEEVFGVALDKFQEDWRAYLMASGLKEIPGMKVSGMGVKLKSNEDLSEEAIESEEIKGHGNKRLKDFVTLGNLLRDRGRLTAASMEYEKAYIEDPFSIITLTKLAYSYMLINKFDEALDILTEAQKLYPDYVTTYSRLGTVYMVKEDYEKSIEYFNESIKINPFIPQVRENLVYIYNILENDELEKKHKDALEKLTSH